MPLDRRIWSHPILSFKRGRKVRIFFEGNSIEAYEGETVAVALYASGHDVLRLSPKLGRPRSVFCMVGKCGSCMLLINGVPSRSCITPVEEGMFIESLKGLPPLPRASSCASKDMEYVEPEALIIGAGPAGIAAAVVLAKQGVSVLLVDDQLRVGGQLIKQTHKFFGSKELFAGLRGYQIAEEYEKRLRKYKSVEILTQTTALGVFKEGVLLGGKDRAYLVRPKVVLIATGATENFLVFDNNDMPGVMGAGGAQTLMNVYGVKPGNEAVVVGAGNVGLIITYQLLQAGVGVKAVIEAAPQIGGWVVHAAKVRRYGVPIITRHTIVGVEGTARVRSAIIAEVNERWEPIVGTEESIKCDTVLLSVGLSPNVDMARQFGAAVKYVPELGGLVALRTRYMETTVPGVFIAGDVAGVEEATTAFMEGWIAGYSMLIKLMGAKEPYVTLREKYVKMLDEYRAGPVSERIRRGLKHVVIGGESS